MLGALSFLTIFGRGSAPTPGAMYTFPVVGALLGLTVGGAWWTAGQWWPALVAGAIAVAVDAALTGLLHLDGLSDSADGLLAPMDRDRRLAVMRDPAVGAFGAVTLIIVLLLRFAAFASIATVDARVILAIGALWCASRSVMAVTTHTMRYARAEGGLATAFQGGPGAARALISGLLGAAIALPMAWFGAGWQGLVALCCAVAIAGLVLSFARARIGGFTGDVLGAVGVLAETAGLLALAATP